MVSCLTLQFDKSRSWVGDRGSSKLACPRLEAALTRLDAQAREFTDNLAACLLACLLALSLMFLAAENMFPCFKTIRKAAGSAAMGARARSASST